MTGVQTCALPISAISGAAQANRALKSVEDQATKTGNITVGVFDRSKNSIERMVKSAERSAQVFGKTGIERLIAQQDQAIKQLEKMGASSAQIDRLKASYSQMIDVQKKLDGQTQSLSKTLMGAAQQLGGMYLSFQGLKTVIKDVAVDSAMFAAKTSTMGVALEAAGKANGISIALLRQQEDQLKKNGIATQEARQSLLRMVVAQIDVNKATELGKLAQNAAIIGLINSSEAFDALVYGIQSANVRVLRTIGINVNFQESYERLAKTLGKTTLELNDEEKAQARVNEVLRVAPQYAGLYEAAMGDVGKQMTSLKRHFDEARNAVGDEFQPALEKVVQTLEKLLKMIKDHPELGTGLTALATGGLMAGGARFLLGPTAGLGAGMVAAAGVNSWASGKIGRWIGESTAQLIPGVESAETIRNRNDLAALNADARKKATSMIRFGGTGDITGGMSYGAAQGLIAEIGRASCRERV